MKTLPPPGRVAGGPRGVPPIERAKQKGLWRRRRRRLSAYLFAVPALVLVVGMFWYSIVMTVWLSFTNSNGLTSAQFIGLANYRAMLNDPELLTNVYNTLIWAIAMIILPVSLGLVAAVALKRRRGRSVFQTVFYLPYAIGFVTTGVIWSFLFGTSGFSELFSALGLRSLANVQWLNQVPLNTYSMIVASTWQTMGTDMLLFFVGLDTIDRQVTEAASLDGAVGWSLFRFITWPSLSAMTRVIIAISIVNALQAFNLIWVMTQGGPYGSSSTFAVWTYQQSFQYYKMGYGAAIAVVLTIFVLVASIGYLRRSLREVRA
jgi:ABC-type sugar transport system permease subunit